VVVALGLASTTERAFSTARLVEEAATA
jgi:hypothetical protein